MPAIPQADPDDEVDVLDDAADEPTIFRYDITAYGADYPVDGLVKRLQNEDIIVPPFQRGYIWPSSRAIRFIESLLLGLPVPGVFLSKEPDSGKLLVIDGQQRLKTLQFFYEGTFGEKRFRLKEVVSEFDGKTYATLDAEDRRRLDDSILHATIVQQNEPSEDQSSIFHIFERLNTGGVLLQAQEIRACIHHGDFSALLSELNGHNTWREIYGPPSARMKDQELILRFLALHCERTDYRRPMKEFLNKFMAGNKMLQRRPGAQLTGVFRRTIDCIRNAIGARAFRPERTLNAAVYDAVMVGVASRLESNREPDDAKLAEAYERLLSDGDFQEATTKATADNQAVDRRISLAIAAFNGV